MDKRKIISLHIPHRHWYTCPIALPVHRNLLSQSLPHLVGHHPQLWYVLETIYRPNCEPLYAINTSQRKQETFLYKCPLHWVLLLTNTHNWTLLLGRSLPNTVAILTTETSLWTSWTVLLPSDTMENLLRLLQLFYFHLWPIYWLSLVYICNYTTPYS
jgi:hypothetical protein